MGSLRMGVARNRGWTLTDGYIRRAIAGTPPNPPTASDVFLALEQKGVDMRIGIDVATLTLKRIVDRVILISGDTDMIPAIRIQSAHHDHLYFTADVVVANQNGVTKSAAHQSGQRETVGNGFPRPRVARHPHEWGC